MSDKYGWLNLKGEFEECKRWGHFEAPCIQEIWDEQGFQDRVDDAEAGCLALIAEDEHPEWHTYEMCLDGLQGETIELAYKKGLIRVGTRGMDVHFEYGSGAMVDGVLKECRHKHALAFAKEIGCFPYFEHVHWA